MPKVRRSDIEQRLSEGHFFWLDVSTLDDEERVWLTDLLHIHPLTVDDATHFGERPKVEDYESYVSLVLYGCSGGAPAAPGEGGGGAQAAEATGPAGSTAVLSALHEIHCLVSERFMVTIHQDHCPALSGLADHVRERGIAVVNGRRLFYRVADSLVDSFFPVLSDLDDRIDTLQDLVIREPDESQLAELLVHRRSLIRLRRVITPQRDVFAQLAGGVVELPGFDQDSLRYHRDVYDHLIRLSDLVDSYRDLLSGTTDAYLSVQSNQLNVVMKQMTIISTIFLPLSFLTGFFGQNFAFLVNHIGSPETFVGLGLGSEVAAVVGLLALFRRRGWLGSSPPPPRVPASSVGARDRPGKTTGSLRP